MSLPLSPPLKPELALSRKTLPTGEDYVYEVKLDGFRCIVFVDGEEVFLQSRNGRPLGRYFPELTFPPGQYVLDGEIVVRTRSGTPSRGAGRRRLGTRGLRRARATSPSGGFARAASLGRDPGGVHRLRPARLRAELVAGAAFRSTPQRPGANVRSGTVRRIAGRADGLGRHAQRPPSRGWRTPRA